MHVMFCCLLMLTYLPLNELWMGKDIDFAMFSYVVTLPIPLTNIIKTGDLTGGVHVCCTLLHIPFSNLPLNWEGTGLY
jgi:hypothetical protein